MIRFCQVVAGVVFSISPVATSGYIACPSTAMIGWTYDGAKFTQVDLPTDTPPAKVDPVSDRAALVAELAALQAKLDSPMTGDELRRTIQLLLLLAPPATKTVTP